MRGRRTAAAGILVLILCTGTGARGSTGTTCSWPARLDPTVVNSLYPDQFASYWMTSLPAAPGMTLTITGEFPHSRYMSFVSYNAALQSVDGLNDLRIDPVAGSTNPFRPGADRTAPKRTYSVTVEFAQRPASAPNNILYTTNADGSKTGTNFLLAYRVFRADHGKDDRGGVGLPQITINLPGAPPMAIPQCDAPGFGENGVNDAFANGNSAAGPPTNGSGTNPPTWHKFFNFATSVSHATDSEQGSQLSDALQPYTTMLPKGGFMDNPDNNYIYSFVNRGRGAVLVLHGKMPTTPRTFDGEPSMGTGQLRYWSLCSNHALSQRYYACLADDQIVTDANGFYTIVISQPQDRPAGAHPEDGVNWLAWGATNDMVLIIRNMLPEPTFTHSIQAAGYGTEAADMAEYYPSACYLAHGTDFPSATCPGAGATARARLPFEHTVHDEMECGNMHAAMNKKG